jgi:chromosome partitioning protein
MGVDDANPGRDTGVVVEELSMRVSMGSCLKRATPVVQRKTLPEGDRCAKVVAVAAQKGGVGKTTTSLSLASAWARFHGKRVLLIDLDPQGHVGVALRDQVRVGGGALSEVLVERSGSLEVEDVATDTDVPDLWVTPADPGLLTAEDRMAGRIGKELALKRALEITRTWYDLIVLDCPPNVGTLTVNALVAADEVLIPADMAALAMAGVAGLLGTVEEVREQLNPELGVLGVVLTRIDGRTQKTNAAVLELVQQTWGDALVPVQIGVNSALAQAQLAGRDIYDFEPTSRGAQQYRELAECLLSRMAGD